VGCNITECIRLAEATLQCPGNLDPSTRKHSETLHQPLAGAGDIFSAIDRVDRSIAMCIEPVENTLHPRKSEAPIAAFSHNFEDFVDQLGEVLSLT
jgi:nitrate/nitrite-specific signal transduction histidine kinase